MTAQHRRLRQVAAILAMLLFIMAISFIALVSKYNELESEHLATYAAYETCDAERYAP